MRRRHTGTTTIRNLFRITTITGLILMSAGNDTRLSAQSVDRSQAPATEELDAVAFPHFEEMTLSNGLKVFFVPDPRPSVTLRLLIPGGSAVDGDRPGRAGMVADLLTKGSAGLTAQEFASEIDFLGGGISAQSDEDRITVSASGLKSRIEPIIDLYTGVITSPAFDGEELAKYQSMAIEGLKASRQSPDFLAEQGVRKILYGNTPLGVMPTEELVSAVTVEDLQEYHAAYFSPKNAILAVVGNFEVDELRALLEKSLGSWDVTTLPDVPSKPMNFTGGRVVLIDRPTSVQSAIRVVGPGPLPDEGDRTRMKIVGDILGGGTGLGNRLTSNLRETHGWTYSPYAYFTSNRYAGYYIAAADVRNEVTDSALTEMLSEIDGMSSSAVPDDELQLNIRSAAGTYIMSLANPNLTAMRVQQIAFYGMDRDYYDRLVDIYHTTGSEEVLELARKYFDPSDRSILIVGKASEVGESLKRFGEVEVWNTMLEPEKSVDAADLELDAATIWGRFLDAMGGADALRTVRTMESEGKIALAANGQEFPGTYFGVSAYPKDEYFRLSLNVNGQVMNLLEQVVTAEGAVQYQMGTEVPFTPGLIDSIVRTTHIMGEAWHDELGATLELKGLKSTQDGDVYEIVVHIPGASSSTYLIDAETFLSVRRQFEGMEIRYDAWKEIGDGIRQPSSMTYIMEGQEITVEDMKYTINGEIDRTLFDRGS